MDIRGHESISEALQRADIEANVEPLPSEGEREAFVTIGTDEGVAPADVLNALAKAMLLAPRGMCDAVFRSGPQLEIVFGQPGSVTFIDTNNWN